MNGTTVFGRGIRLVLTALSTALASPVLAGAEALPIKIAVFDFELNDLSAAAGIAGSQSADRAYLDQATTEARRLLADSGRYRLVEVAGAQGDHVETHALSQCDGCDVRVAEKLGAEQSLVGVVTRLSRTEFTVHFLIRDTKTGAIVANKATDLRMGADYAWSRGVASLIKNQLLGGS
jgi:hypothetical protein